MPADGSWNHLVDYRWQHWLAMFLTVLIPLIYAERNCARFRCRSPCASAARNSSPWRIHRCCKGGCHPGKSGRAMHLLARFSYGGHGDGAGRDARSPHPADCRHNIGVSLRYRERLRVLASAGGWSSNNVVHGRNARGRRSSPTDLRRTGVDGCGDVFRQFSLTEV